MVEALLDIRVVPRADVSIDELSQLSTVYLTEYPKRTEKRKAAFRFAVDMLGNGESPLAEAMPATPDGLMFSDEARKNLVQVSLDRFTQNMLAPYVNFETLAAKARANWNAYRASMRPLGISRIAVRYINELRLPLGESIESNLIAFPRIPAAVTQTVSDFAVRLTITDEALGARAVVTQFSQGAADEGGLQAFLDIDTIMERQIETDAAALWDYFEALRRFKNNIFFSFLSPTLLQRYM